jgi:hypothetical protein
MRSHFLAMKTTITSRNVSPKNCIKPWTKLGSNLAISLWLYNLAGEGSPTILYNTNATSTAAKIRIAIRMSMNMGLVVNAPLLYLKLPVLFLKAAMIHLQFIAIWTPAKSITKFKGELCAARQERSLIVCIPRPGSTTWEIVKPETNSVITSMNKTELRKKLNRVRLVAILKNFRVAFWIHGHAIRRCIIIKMKKIKPNASCNANPVILGERSKIKMIRRAVSKQTTNLLRGDAIILLIFKIHPVW